jgi:hypothetical protein
MYFFKKSLKMSERNKATQSYHLKPGYQWGDEDAGMAF